MIFGHDKTYRKGDPLMELLYSDDSVYHYTRRATALEKILWNGTFRLSSLSLTNDPYEYRDKMLGACGWGDWVEIKDQIHAAKAHVRDYTSSGVFLASTCANTREGAVITRCGGLKPRMWAQYGENHEGVCLVLSKKGFQERIKGSFGHPGFFLLNGSVAYCEHLSFSPRCGGVHVDADSLARETPENLALRHVQSHGRELFFRKPADYRDEEEYRFVVVSREGNGKAFLEIPLAGCLKAILLGDRFPEVYGPVFPALAEKHQVPVKQVFWEKNRYWMRDIA